MVNEAQKDVLFHKIHQHFSRRTQRTRRSRSGAWLSSLEQTMCAKHRALVLIDAHLRLVHSCGFTIPRHWQCPSLYGERLAYCDRPYGALEQADALAVVTEWNEFRNPDFEVMRRLMRQPIIFDGRNVYRPSADGRTWFCLSRDWPGQGHSMLNSTQRPEPNTLRRIKPN